MELPKFGSDRGVFSDLKSKLGFSGQGGKADDGYYDDGYDGYDDEYDDYEDGYDDYSDYGSGSDYDRTYTGTRYDSDDAVTTRPARSSSRSDGFPRLVSIDDVRAHTRVPDSLNRDPLPARHVTSASPRRLDREVVSASSPAPSSPAYVAAAAAREAEQSRSEGLDSLFSSTTPARTSHTSTASSGQRSSFDPYEAYSGSGTVSHDPSRSLSVLQPTAYGDVERVAKILKAGDAVVLSLRETPDQLSKRVLDFSFGVASALDARVECVADKVFSITRGSALNDAERTALRNKGVL